MMIVERDEILQNYLDVKNKIAQTCIKSERLNTVKLIVISKFQSADKIRGLLEAGQRDFGESRVEEIKKKWPALLMDYPDAKLHFIGPIQSRKVRDIVKYADYVHSVDRLDIAEHIARESQVQHKITECLIQVNVGAEPQKSGIEVAQFPTLLMKCRGFNTLSVRGAMCIPPVNQNPTQYFMLMRNLQVNHDLKELSMGMSSDYSEAITCGATMIRVGSKIMGSRINS